MRADSPDKQGPSPILTQQRPALGKSKESRFIPFRHSGRRNQRSSGPYVCRILKKFRRKG